jgi:hypothetical protein
MERKRGKNIKKKEKDKELKHFGQRLNYKKHRERPVPLTRRR